MNVEQNRLDTFHEWPNNAVVPPSRIARAGFFHTKTELIVECFACHMRISDWNYGDQVMARHRALNPSCPFVVSPTTSGNVPKISPSNTSTDVPASSSLSGEAHSHTQSMKNEAARLRTFATWPIPAVVAPESLARAGFYYLKTGDSTKCAFCKGVVRAWELGDDPDHEHKRHFEDCPFVVADIIPRLAAANSESAKPFTNLNLVGNKDNLQYLGVQAHKGPKKPSYATIEARLRTFSSWPPDLIQTPDVLSQAGFYYEGMGDQVRCFHCDGGLRHWDPQDDPWTEHARWFPRCSFIKLVKGQEFVTACSLEMNVNSNLEEVDQKHSQLPFKKREVTEQEVQAYMTSEIALSALSIGLNVERVKRAIRDKLERTGRGYSQPDALVEAALNLQHDEETEDDMGGGGGGADDEINGSTRGANLHVKNVLDNLIAKSCNSSNSESNQSQMAGEKQTKNNLTGTGTGTATVSNLGGKSNSEGGCVSLEEENRILKEARLCKICMDAEVGIVFLPCGHLTTCVNCAPNLEDCPVCRSAIKATVRTFLS